jgi:hypothetical protein
MSCDAISLSAFLWLAAVSPAAASPSSPVALAAPTPVAGEPLFVDIVDRAGRLKAQSEAFAKVNLDGQVSQLPGFSAYETAIAELSDLDMKGHVLLAARGTDGDLKCILKGISQDLPVKLKALEAAPDAKARLQAVKELTYLLRDNVEVITSPPAPPA